MKSYYLAIVRSPNDGLYFLDPMLYTSEEEAKERLGAMFVRLIGQGIPLPEPEVKVMAKIKVGRKLM